MKPVTTEAAERAAYREALNTWYYKDFEVREELEQRREEFEEDYFGDGGER